MKRLQRFQALFLFFTVKLPNQKTPQQPDTVPLPDFIVFFQNERYNIEKDKWEFGGVIYG